MNCSDVSFEFIGHHEPNLIKHDDIKLCKYEISYVNLLGMTARFLTVLFQIFIIILCFTLLNLFLRIKWNKVHSSKTF
jgi:hypothetical protein